MSFIVRGLRPPTPRQEGTRRASLRSARLALAAAALAVSGLGMFASCATVIGVDDYRDAVADICKCEELSFLGSVQNCESTLTRRLDGASEETRAKWLARFAEDDCATCSKSKKCFYSAPTCSVGSCGDSAECCGANNGTGYCANGSCFKESQDCLPTGAPCTSVDECCGSELPDTATCEDRPGDGPVCLETCGPGAPNCPGCCAVFFLEGSGEQLHFCADEKDEATCALVCNPDESDPCPMQGQSCLLACGIMAPGLCLYVCQ